MRVPDRDRMDTWRQDASPTDAPATSKEPTAEEMARAMGIDLHQLPAALEVMSAEDRRGIRRVVMQARTQGALGDWKGPK